MASRDDSAIGVIDAVRRDHREIEEMIAEVENAKGQSREEAFAALAQKLKAHETAEQEVVHPITDEVGAPDVADSVEKEESKASQLLASMEDLDVSSAECVTLRTRTMVRAPYSSRSTRDAPGCSASASSTVLTMPRNSRASSAEVGTPSC